MSNDFTRRLATLIANRAGDIPSPGVSTTTGVAVRLVDERDEATDSNGDATTGGLPMPGWWVRVDGIEVAIPVIAGHESGIEPGMPVWVLSSGGARVLLGGVSTGRNDFPDWLDDLPMNPIHPWARLGRYSDVSVPDAAWTPVTWSGPATNDPWGAPERRGSNDETDKMAFSGFGSVGGRSGFALLRVPFDGIWQASVQVGWAASSVGVRAVRLGTTWGTTWTNWRGMSAIQAVAQAGWGTVQHATSGPRPCLHGDWWTVDVQQTSGAALNLIADYSWFGLHYVGPGPVPARSPNTARKTRGESYIGTTAPPDL